MPTGTLTLNQISLDATCDAVYLLDDADVPVDGSVVYEASLDGGTTWVPVTAGELTALGHAGTTLDVRAVVTLDSESDGQVDVYWFLAYATSES